MHLPVRTLVCVAMAVAISSVGAQDKLTNYQLVVLKPGPAHASGSSPEGQKTIKAHVDFIYKLGADGHAMAAGPFLQGSGNIGGIIVMKVDSPDKARELEADDPAVKAGIYTFDVMPFMALDTGIRRWAEFPQFERVYFGFLNSGPNRSQDAETAKRLQAEHLAYMDAQHKEGKLVFAGPFVSGGNHRGLVVYRVDSMEEAKRRAEGDPMIKVGRLAVDLHTWQVPKNALPD